MADGWFTVKGRARLVLTLLLLLLAACGSGGDNDDDGGDAGPPPTPTYDIASRMTDLTAANVDMTAEDQLLVWVAPGTSPAAADPGETGRLYLVAGNGAATHLLDVPGGASRVIPCGDRATSSGGRYFAFFMGGETGGLYLMDGINAPTALASGISALSCAGNGTFSFNGSGERLGFIDFVPGATNTPLARGMLYIHSTTGGAPIADFENVAAFDLTETGAAFISVFTNSSGEVTEAAVFRWESGEPDEITTLFAGNGCQFTSARVVQFGPLQMGALMGERCTGTGTRWTVFSVDTSARSATPVASGDAVGSFLSYARSGGIYAAPGAGAVVHTVPDGVLPNSVTLRAARLDGASTEGNLVRYGIMPRYYTNRAFSPEDNVAPILSPDGRWLAVASNTPNNDAAVNVIDLAEPDLPPIRFSAGERGDTVSSMAFTPDSSALLFVAGGHSGDSNSLFALNLVTGVEARIIRGRFNTVLAAPDGLSAALGAWEVLPDDPTALYMTLTVVSLGNNQSATLYTGAQLEEGRVNDAHFVLPLSWRS